MAKRHGKGRKKSTSTKRRRTSSRQKPAGMARKGSKCKRFKTVYSKTLGRKVRRCAEF